MKAIRNQCREITIIDDQQVGSVSPFSSHLYSTPGQLSSQDALAGGNPPWQEVKIMLADGTRNQLGRESASYSREPLASYPRDPPSSYSRDPPSSPYSAFFRPTPSPCSTYQVAAKSAQIQQSDENDNRIIHRTRPSTNQNDLIQDYSPYPSLSSSPASSRPPSRGSCTSDMRSNIWWRWWRW